MLVTTSRPGVTDITERIHALVRVAHEAMKGKDLESAARHAEQALQLASESLGPSHAETAMPYSALAVIYNELRKHIMAEFCAQSAMHILVNSNQGDTLHAARTRVALAVALCMQHNLEGVDDLFESALDSIRKNTGERSPEMIMALNNQAVAYARTGKAFEAEQIFHRLYELLGETPSAAGIYQHDILINLALSTHVQGEIARAIGYAELALEKAMCFQIKDYAKIADFHGLLWNIHVSEDDRVPAEYHARKMMEIISHHGSKNVDAETIRGVTEFIASLGSAHKGKLS